MTEIEQGPKVQFILGIVFTSLCVVFLLMAFIFSITLTDDPDAWIPIAVMGMMFIPFAGVGIGFLVYALWRKSMNRRLKTTGLAFDGEVTRTYFNAHMRANHRIPMVVEAVYTNHFGQKVLVKSGNLWLPLMYTGFFTRMQPLHPDTLRAKVYVDRDDPRKYYVSVFQELAAGNAANVGDVVDYR